MGIVVVGLDLAKSVLAVLAKSFIKHTIRK